MFYVGLGITLSGVYLLSQRDMKLLKPIQRFRARVFVVIFILRTKKVIQNRNNEVREKLGDGSRVTKLDNVVPGLALSTLPGTVDEGNVDGVVNGYENGNVENVNTNGNGNGNENGKGVKASPGSPSPPRRERANSNGSNDSPGERIRFLSEGHLAISPRVEEEIEKQKSEVKRTKMMLKRRGSVGAIGVNMPKRSVIAYAN